MPQRIPSYRLHRPSGQAVVTLSGRDYYLGKHGSESSKTEYARLIQEWLACNRFLPPVDQTGAPADLTIAELLDAYLNHVDSYYVKNGKPTSEVRSIKAAIRPLQRLYGGAIAREFGSRSLKAVRQAMIDAKRCRKRFQVIGDGSERLGNRIKLTVELTACKQPSNQIGITRADHEFPPVR
jgi:hypothetical protein